MHIVTINVFRERIDSDYHKIYKPANELRRKDQQINLTGQVDYADTQSSVMELLKNVLTDRAPGRQK